MVPPWVPDPVPPNPPQDGDGRSPTATTERPIAASPNQPLASNSLRNRNHLRLRRAARFSGARLNLGNFARSGDRRDMRRGLRDYVRKGYGGGGRRKEIWRYRFNGCALYGALSSSREERPQRW